MKVHRIITTIEVENDNSITSIELTKLYLASDCILLAITNFISITFCYKSKSPHSTSI
jgi:hypothetical protein